jgi:hypothetical protein
VTPEEAAISKLVGCLEAAGVAYMVTGSLASTHHGRPRSTHDVDVVIDPSAQALTVLVSALLAAGFYVDPETAADALRRRRQFNAIETDMAIKIDLIIRKERDFSREELSRRQPADLASGARIMLATAEDCILSKLEWSKRAGGSEKQLEDVAGVLEVQGDALDLDYIQRWAPQLGVADLWDRVRRGPGRE